MMHAYGIMPSAALRKVVRESEVAESGEFSIRTMWAIGEEPHGKSPLVNMCKC